ncbi:MAG: hypothetical protein H0V14_00530 [Chitinophagaceae bacterium]|nr:hypothetical protein [Chitinophagaceae bacterium]
MKIAFKIFVINLLILLVNAFIANCQEIKITQLPILQDATWLVTGISQDPQGYMWFGTKRTGFYRYDGYNLTSYKNQASNPNTLSYDAVESLHADSKGIIWVGTFGRGLDRYDPATGNFTHFRFATNDPTSLGNDTITTILEDSQANLWIGTYGGVGRMDSKTGKFAWYRYDPADLSSLSCNQVRTIYQDKQGTIWVGTGSAFYENYTCDAGGLNRLDINTGKFTRYLHNPKDPHSLIDNRVRAIFEDKYGTFYVGTAGDGLHTMDRKTGKFFRHLYDPKQPEKLSRPPIKKDLGYVYDHITFITEDVTGAIWIGTFAGLSRYDQQTQKIKYYQSFNDTLAGVKDDIGWMAYSSRDGVLWFSTVGRGNLYQVDPFLKKINHYDIQDQVNTIYNEAPGIYWLGTRLDGLIRDDRINGTQQRFPYPTITSIRLNNEGKLWIGTIGGLFLFDPQTQTSTPYKPRVSESRSDEYIISNLFVTKQGNLWIGTTKSLDYLNTKSGSFSHYTHNINDTSSLSENSVTFILEDNHGRLWVGTQPDGGLNLLNHKTGKFKHYLKGRGITGTIYQDSWGTIWVGTHDGLYRFNPDSDTFNPFADPNTGASLNFILSILEDDKKNLWIVTGNELIKINQKRNGIIRFGKKEGIKPNTGYWGNNSGGNGKEIFFGDQSGYYVFNPAHLTVNTRPPQILLTDFSITAQELKPGVTNSRKQEFFQGQDIRLSYNEDIFSFNLAAIHYSNTAENRLIYMLENYDKAWRESGVGQKAYYFNVPPGKYTLKIKAANGNSIWSQKSIPIYISPPWWRTWWAYTIYGLLLIGVLFAFDRFQRLRLLEKERERARAHELTQAKEIERAYHELSATQTQLIQREKMASLGELTAGIAHEIQNPLNFVKNFSEVNMELLSEIDEAIEKGNTSDAKTISGDIRQNLEKITHHGKRAESIVKGMLHHSRSSTNKKEPTDINDLVDECLRLTYHGLRAKDKSFNAKMQSDFDGNVEQINIIPQDIGRVFLNLFTNAFYSVIEKKKSPLTPEREIVNPQSDYVPTVTVSTSLNPALGSRGAWIEIRVRDNGMGIPQQVIDKIFQPFFTTKPTGQGTGLGLSLSYDIIKAHAGELKVETKEGEFAEFIIQLQVV